MISYIEGQVLFLEAGYAVIKTNGVGYHILLNKRDLELISAGNDANLFVHTHVREDAIELYGFFSREHKQIFLLLINVSGIGPKLAQSILSALSPRSLINAIIDKDIATLSTIPGIGKKTAERMALELKDKALKIDISREEMGNNNNATIISLEQAIKSLGYSKAQSEKALLSLDQDDLMALPLEELIKKSLNFLSGSKAS